jgi:anti-anti-sigma regulatory factor
MTASADRPDRVAFEGALTLRTIVDARDRLLRALSENASIVIDCSAAAEIDLSGAQLILAALKSAARSGKQISFDPPMPPALRSLLAAAGLADAFENLTGGPTSAPVPAGEA